MRDRPERKHGRERMPAQNKKLGAFVRRLAHRRPRLADAATYLFGSPKNAARLREAIDDSRANRNMVPFTFDDLRRELRGGAS
ncbi:MAG TPA: hypothetical protein VF632_04910 [Longimicrobium sp.]